MEIAIRCVPDEHVFDEAGYLLANPDVSDAVKRGDFSSALEHFIKYGRGEGRQQENLRELDRFKRMKLGRIRPLLRNDMPMREMGGYFDFLTGALREEFNIVDTDNVSSNSYPAEALALIDKHRDGVILDCGAGRRSIYYSNVVNFEIVAYESTDVRGVGERLPFDDNTFDAVFSLAVLEHVKDPFQCAAEIMRVLKPGGELLCMVPFLQPMHGYPNHYYNMTKQGILNLFEPRLEVTSHEVPPYALPIWTLTWMLNSWSRGLDGEALEEFLNLRVSDLLAESTSYLDRPFVTRLSDDKNFELACGTTIIGTKRA